MGTTNVTNPLVQPSQNDLGGGVSGDGNTALEKYVRKLFLVAGHGQSYVISGGLLPATQATLIQSIPAGEAYISGYYVTWPTTSVSLPASTTSHIFVKLVFASGVVSGAKDEHCGAKKQVTTQAACSPDAGHSHDTDAMAMDDAGAMSEYGATLYNDEGDDDECKYHVKWTASPVAQGKDVTFTVVATNKSDGSALKAAPIRAEVFLDDTHPGPNTNQTSKESATAGTYTVGPIRFDKPGKWTVRFHFFEDCADGEESPHGHVAFYVQVP